MFTGIYRKIGRLYLPMSQKSAHKLTSPASELRRFDSKAVPLLRWGMTWVVSGRVGLGCEGDAARVHGGAQHPQVRPRHEVPR
eukprot:6333776-Pyramimonas_sp.AAC.2